MQHDITGRIAAALHLELITAEAARLVAHPEALEYVLRGRGAFWKPPSRDNYAEAIRLFECALACDSDSVEAQSWLAATLASRVLDGMTDTAAADIERAEMPVGRALTASPRSPGAHYAKGHVLHIRGRSEEAIPEFETMLASNRNFAHALAGLAWCKFFTGPVEEVILLVDQAIRLSPRDPYIGSWYFRIGRVHLRHSRIEEAIVWFEKSRRAHPAHPLPRRYMAAAFALKSEAKRAAIELAEARKLAGDDRYSSITSLQAALYFGALKDRPALEANFLAGLRHAGVPEE